ncbi:MAG: hypothetical protein OHK0046_01720 [Anaerolineae bacterium]
MVDRNFTTIQTVRRLIRAQRYDEAYILLKETNHPQVPALETKLRALLAANNPPLPSARLITACSLRIGCMVGLLLALPLRAIGVIDLPTLSICFALGFFLGVVMPAQARRHQTTSEMLMQMFINRRHNPPKR